MTFELPNKEKDCHHTGFEKRCFDLVSTGKCKRWRNLPGEDVYTGERRETWGCIDDLVLQLQGQAMRENSGTHTAMTEFRETVLKNHEQRLDEIRKYFNGDVISVNHVKQIESK